MSVTKDEEQEAPKGDQSSHTSSVGSQPSDGKRELAPSSSVRRPSWYKLTLMDAQEQEEAPRAYWGRAGLQRSFQTSWH
jgi:hypothetical protein